MDEVVQKLLFDTLKYGPYFNVIQGDKTHV